MSKLVQNCLEVVQTCLELSKQVYKTCPKLLKFAKNYPKIFLNCLKSVYGNSFFSVLFITHNILFTWSNGSWIWNYHFWSKNDGEKWSRKFILKSLHAGNQITNSIKKKPSYHMEGFQNTIIFRTKMVI